MCFPCSGGWRDRGQQPLALLGEEQFLFSSYFSNSQLDIAFPIVVAVSSLWLRSL